MYQIIPGLLFFLLSLPLQASCITPDQTDQQKFITCQQLANEGDADALNIVAGMYEMGEGTEIDAMKAFRNYERSANLGNVLGQYNLGRLYDQGVNGSKNAYEAVNWLNKAAEQDHLPAMEYLARIYFHGRGVNRNYQKAYQWITRSGGANTAEKHYFLGYLSLNGHAVNKNLKDAYSHLMRAAESGIAEAQFQLGEMYRQGNGVAVDQQKALSWLSKAAGQSHEKAELSIRIIERKRENEEYAQQQKMTSFKAPHVKIEVVSPPQTTAPDKTRQTESSGWGLHILLFFIVLIIAAILFLKTRSSAHKDMTEQEKEVINQALKSQLEKQSSSNSDITHEHNQVSDNDQPSGNGDFYDNSLLDIAKQELEMNTLDKDLWDQVRMEANGDMAKAELLYLKKRVKALMEQK